jgi:hypothetical protein
MWELECVLHEYLSWNWVRVEDILAANAEALRRVHLSDGLRLCTWLSWKEGLPWCSQGFPASACLSVCLSVRQPVSSQWGRRGCRRVGACVSVYQFVHPFPAAKRSLAARLCLHWDCRAGSVHQLVRRRGLSQALCAQPLAWPHVLHFCLSAKSICGRLQHCRWPRSQPSCARALNIAVARPQGGGAVVSVAGLSGVVSPRRGGDSGADRHGRLQRLEQSWGGQRGGQHAQRGPRGSAAPPRQRGLQQRVRGLNSEA